MKVLLGATIALLIGALALSLQGMKEGVQNTPPDEIERLKQQVAELRADKERLDLEREIQDLRAGSLQPSQTVVQEQAVTAESQAVEMDLRAQLAAKEAELARIEEEKESAERDAEVYRDEAGLAGQRELESGDTDLRRSRMIKEALLMGRIAEYREDPEMGDFVVLEILMPENIQEGTVLAIRRNTGILGQLKVSSISPEGAIANIIPGFGPIRPEQGDELILPPQY